MKNTLLSIFVLLISLCSKAQCYVPPINGPSIVRVGQTVSLTISATGGGWSAYYPGLVSIDSVTGTVTGLSCGTAGISYYVPSSCIGQHFSTHTMLVIPKFGGRKKLCIGDTTTLQNMLGTGIWTSSNQTVATIDSFTGLVTAMGSGNTIVTHSFSVSGIPYTATDTIQVASITSVSSIYGSHNTCINTSTFFFATTPVTWLSTNPSVAHIFSVVSQHMYINGDTCGTTQIIFTSDYCRSISDSITFTVNPLPTIGSIDYISGTTIHTGVINLCLGNSVTLLVNGLSDTTGHWACFTPTIATVHDTSFGTGSASAILTALSILPSFTQLSFTTVNSFGCVATANNFFYVPGIALAADSIIGPNNTAVGAHTSYSLLDSSILGVWSVSPTSIATITSAGIVTGLSVGTVILTYTRYTACETNMCYKTIHVTPNVFTATCPAFSAFLTRSCLAPQLGVMTPPHTSAYSLKTIYGDGSIDTIMIAADSATGFTMFNHPYNTSGTYSIKQVLYNGTIALDSVIYSYQHLLCRDFFLSFYSDINNNCNYDITTEYLNCFSLQVAIDSNGIPKDTVSLTGGLYYQTLGNTGDIYSFRIFGMDTSWHFSCPGTGVIYDTLGIGAANSINRFIGIHYPVGTTFDLIQHTTLQTGRHMAIGNILTSNLFTSPQHAIVSLNISPKYIFQSSSPAPTSVIGNTATWDFTGVSASAIPPVINYMLNIPTTIWLLPGDTVHNMISVTPTTGDANPTNNVVIRIDTVKSSYDPNHISVSPEGNILNGTKLHYAIEFENDGNDTAQNIYVMDTLSDALNLSTFRIVGATHAMNIAILHSGGHNIVKFEFPNIKLLDSTHHNKCTGTLFYTINAKTGLANGTQIIAHAGIYFDDNLVVLTDTTINTILLPHVSVATTTGDTICTGEAVHIVANPTSVNTPRYHWSINSVSAGTDSAGLTIPAATVGDTIKCVMTTIMDDTVYSTSNSVRLINRGLPVAGTISGLSAVCAGSNITLTESASTGVWSASSSHVTVSAGIVHGVTTGPAVISYSVTNLCGTVVATHAVTVNPLPDAGTITGIPTLCESAGTTLSNIATAGLWSSSSPSAMITGGVVTGVSAGTSIISYSVTNSCGTAIDTMLITVDPLPNAGTITGTPVVCESATTVLSNSTTSGTWSSSSISAIITGGLVSGMSAGNSIISYAVSNGCGTAIDTMLITVNPLPDAGNITGSSVVCVTGTIALSNTSTGGVWGSSTPSAIIAGGIVTGISVGSSLISYSVTNSCGTAVDTMTIEVSPMPVVGLITGADEVCSDATTVLNNSSAGGIWSSSNVGIAAISGGTVTGVAAGTAIITYMLTNSCGAAVTSRAIHVLSNEDCNTGIATEISSLAEYKVYPNPNAGSFVFTGKINTLSNEAVHYDIIDITGRVLYSNTAQPQNGIINEQINLSGNIVAGQYMLRVVTGNRVEMVRFAVLK